MIHSGMLQKISRDTHRDAFIHEKIFWITIKLDLEVIAK